MPYSACQIGPVYPIDFSEEQPPLHDSPHHSTLRQMASATNMDQMSYSAYLPQTASTTRSPIEADSPMFLQQRIDEGRKQGELPSRGPDTSGTDVRCALVRSPRTSVHAQGIYFCTCLQNLTRPQNTQTHRPIRTPPHTGKSTDTDGTCDSSGECFRFLLFGRSVSAPDASASATPVAAAAAAAAASCTFVSGERLRGRTRPTARVESPPSDFREAAAPSPPQPSVGSEPVPSRRPSPELAASAGTGCESAASLSPSCELATGTPTGTPTWLALTSGAPVSAVSPSSVGAPPTLTEAWAELAAGLPAADLARQSDHGVVK
jgi:hypothetical protein